MILIRLRNDHFSVMNNMNSEKSISQEIESAMKRLPVKVRKNKELLDEILTSKGLLGLLHFVREKPESAKVLFLNHLDLFGTIGQTRAPYLYLGSERKKSHAKSKILENKIISLKAEQSLASMALMVQFGLNKEEIERAGRDLLDAVVYALVTLFRTSTKLKTLITSDEFNFKILRESVKDYSDVISENQINEVLRGLLKESKDPELMKTITRLIRTLFVGIGKRPIEFFRIVNLSTEMFLLEQHQNTSNIVSELLRKASISSESYVDLLDRLFIDNLIQTVSSIFWCENCGDEKARYFELHGQFKPSQMMKWKCPNCGKKGLSSSVFALDSLLLDCIYGQDGFLGLYFAWRLTDEGIPFESGVTIDGYECDFISNDTLIECKMFQMPGRDSTNIENLESVVADLKKKVELSSSDDRKIEYTILLWNQTDSTDLVEHISVKNSEFIDEFQFKIYTYDTIANLNESLKS